MAAVISKEAEIQHLRQNLINPAQSLILGQIKMHFSPCIRKFTSCKTNGEKKVLVARLQDAEVGRGERREGVERKGEGGE